MKVVTCITNQNQVGYVNALKASCKYHGLELVTLIIEDYVSHRQRTRSIRKWLETVESDELILFTDGYDTILVADEQEILAKYNRISPNDKIIMSADRLCGIGYIGPEFFTKTPFGYDYMCSGGYVGKAKILIEAIDSIYKLMEGDNTDKNKECEWDDHYEWTKFYANDQSDLVLDTNCEIFQTFTTQSTVANLQQYYLVEGKVVENEDLYQRESLKNAIKDALNELEITDDLRIFNKSTKTYPVQIHFVSEINKLIMFMEPFVKLVDKVN
jgi:hypothetical protein